MWASDWPHGRTILVDTPAGFMDSEVAPRSTHGADRRSAVNRQSRGAYLLTLPGFSSVMPAAHGEAM